MNPFTATAPEIRPNRKLPPTIIPLGKAYFCIDCEQIHTSIRCPKCDRAESIPLEKWLGSTKEEH